MRRLHHDCLAYVAHTSLNELARGRIVIAVRPWLAGDAFQVGEAKFSEPRDADIWWIKAARDGDTLPAHCTCQGLHIKSEVILSIERAVHLIPLSGPGLISEADVLRERARDLLSHRVFPDISELDRAVGRVAIRKLFF